MISDPEETLTDAELIAILQRIGLLPPQGTVDPVAEEKFGLDCSVNPEGRYIIPLSVKRTLI
jgi:hypothetical protein